MNEVYRLAESKAEKTRYFINVRYVKEEDQKILINGKDIKRKWKKNFRSLSNEFPRENQDKVK